MRIDVRLCHAVVRVLAVPALLLTAAACGGRARSAALPPGTASATWTSTAISTPPPPTATATPLPPTPTPTPFPLPPPMAPVAGRPAWSPELLDTVLRRGDSARQVVYLTFDDGWGYPDQVLQILRQRWVPATACLAGQFMRTHAAFVRAWLAAGETLCNHTYDHPHLLSVAGTSPLGQRTVTMDEILRTEALLGRIAPGAVMAPFFRPPYGEQDDAVRNGAAWLGYRTILWSLEDADYRPGLDPAAVRNAIVGNAHNGDIILLHFERWSTVEALPSIIDGLRARGFTILGLQSLPSGR